MCAIFQKKGKNSTENQNFAKMKKTPGDIIILYMQGPNLETKIASQKSRKTFSGFVKRFGEFAKGIYEICSHNNFNLALIVFSSVQFILFYVLLAKISEEP